MTNPPPVAAVVTDEMVQAALKIACNQRPVGCGDGDTYTVSVPTFFSMRAAITAALEASGELERLRAALRLIKAYAVKRQNEGGPDGNLKAIEGFARHGLGDAP